MPNGQVIRETVTTTTLPSGPHQFGGREPARPVPHQGRKVVEVDLPMPPMGGKAWLLSEKGIFVLQRGPGTIRTLAITHAGAGNLEVIDGIPDDDGFFPAEKANLTMPVREQGEAGVWESDTQWLARLKSYHTRNGRPFYRANPIVMGSWMLDAGFMHGLTLRVHGGHESTSAVATVVWVPFKSRVA